MSYTLLTWDGDGHSLDDTTAKRLIEAWTNANSSFPVNLGIIAISSSSIKSISKDRFSEADRIAIFDTKQLKSDNRTDKQQYKAARKSAESVREILKRKGMKL